MEHKRNTKIMIFLGYKLYAIGNIYLYILHTKITFKKLYCVYMAFNFYNI